MEHRECLSSQYLSIQLMISLVHHSTRLFCQADVLKVLWNSEIELGPLCRFASMLEQKLRWITWLAQWANNVHKYDQIDFLGERLPLFSGQGCCTGGLFLQCPFARGGRTVCLWEGDQDSCWGGLFLQCPSETVGRESKLWKGCECFCLGGFLREYPCEKCCWGGGKNTCCGGDFLPNPVEEGGKCSGVWEENACFRLGASLREYPCLKCLGSLREYPWLKCVGWDWLMPLYWFLACQWPLFCLYEAVGLDEPLPILKVLLKCLSCDVVRLVPQEGCSNNRAEWSWVDELELTENVNVYAYIPTSRKQSESKSLCMCLYQR